MSVATVDIEPAERIDAELAAQSRAEAALRLRLGQALEVLGRGGCFELGFSSLTAYALERCERSARWVEGARCLARRLEVLPVLRRAVAFGAVSWSKAALVARVAAPANEEHWTQIAERLTVRQLCARVNEEAPQEDGMDSPHADDSGEMCTLVCTVDREEAWLFEATRALLRQLGTCSTDEQIEALLAEAQINLLDALPPGSLDLEATRATDSAAARWREYLARWRAEAELRCEEGLGRASAPRHSTSHRGPDTPDGGCKALTSTMRAAAQGCSALGSLTPKELDTTVRSLARALAEHEIALSRLILALHRADGWRRLGRFDEHGSFIPRYATEAQYARERLGMSRSALLARRTLALKLESLPNVAEALGQSRIGVEAALQLVRIATPKTELAWLARAQQRTIKHLREEVNAALTAVRVSRDANCPPPAETEIDAFHELERAAATGRIFYPTKGGEQSRGGERAAHQSTAWRVTLASLADWLAHGVQMCAGHGAATKGAPADGTAGSSVQTSAGRVRHVGRVELRLRVSRETYRAWRDLEQQAHRFLPRGMTWLGFCCLSLWRAWRHLLDADVAYGHIYMRDRYRCTSPVCTRRDVTPHHIRFRSAGGSDRDDNVTSVCTWCHLLGIHGGRIRAVGSANRIRWELGRREDPCLVVHGRERRAA